MESSAEMTASFRHELTGARIDVAAGHFVQQAAGARIDGRPGRRPKHRTGRWVDREAAWSGLGNDLDSRSGRWRKLRLARLHHAGKWVDGGARRLSRLARRLVAARRALHQALELLARRGAIFLGRSRVGDLRLQVAHAAEHLGRRGPSGGLTAPYGAPARTRARRKAVGAPDAVLS